MKQYQHLTQRERYLIEYHLSSGKKQKEIANILGRNPSTISREIRRNKHTNGLIRQYLPKKTDFTKIDYKTIKMIQNRLNNRPRKSLGFKTPKEALLEEIA
jgi:IS30 family transposase